MIILRREKFGGIAFNPDNAHEIWMDKQYFDEFINALEKSDKNLSNIKEAFDKLEIKNNRFVLFDNKIDSVDDFPYTVLSSPVLADINITNKCNLCCPHCYVNSNKNGYEMSHSDFLIALDQCKKFGVMQIALGGGEPTTHPDFTKFLKLIRENNIVPNVTTNGRRLSWKTVYGMARYAGAVALSLEEIGDKFKERRGFLYSDFLKSIRKLKAAGVRLVFQITISKDNLDRVDQTAQEMLRYKPYGIIFLAYKPQGRGKGYNLPLSEADHSQVTQKLKNIFKELGGKTKIGFDCCITPEILSVKKSPSFTGCSGSRTSIAIMPDLRVMPCSFLEKDNRWDSLKDKDLPTIWFGKNFNNFRGQILSKMEKPGCSQCQDKNICLGGCPAFNLAGCDQLASI